MAVFRTAIPDFQLANPLYVGASVTFYEADENGAKTTTAATLYADPTGTTVVSNPQILDSDGKFARAVYIEGPVVADIVGNTVGTHTTGVIGARGTWKGDFATSTRYYVNDELKYGGAGAKKDNIYRAAQDFTSDATTIETDISSGNLVLIVDVETVNTQSAAAVQAAVDTAADLALTNADVVLTNADVVLTNADVVLTGLDLAATNANVVLTNADVVSTNADVVTMTALLAQDVRQLSVISLAETAPPGSPSAGDIYIPAATATGAWAGQENNIAEWTGSAWAFTAPQEGWKLWDRINDLEKKWSGSAWTSWQDQDTSTTASVTFGSAVIEGRDIGNDGSLLDQLFSTPFCDIWLNGSLDVWSTEPSSGEVTTAGGGADFDDLAICDGLGGGPGPGATYKFSRTVDEAEYGSYYGNLQWTAAVSSGEAHHNVAGQITSGYWRFSFLENRSKFPPAYAAGKKITFDCRLKATGNLTVVPIVFISMGNPAWNASTVYKAGDIVKNDSAGGEFGNARLYTCTVGGTSAGSGGPTGTTTGITDNTVTWDYLGESKGREYELYERGADDDTMQIAWGDPHANASIAVTTAWQDFTRTIYVPDLSEGTGTEYSGQANDSGSRVFTPPKNGGYLGGALDFYATGAQGPTIQFARMMAYIGVKPTGGRVQYPKGLALLAYNGATLLINSLYGAQGATQAEQIAGTATNRRVTPANQQHHKSAAKCWATWDSSTASFSAEYNMTSVANTGVGNETVTIDNNFVDGNWCPSGSANTSNSTSAPAGRDWSWGNRTNTALQILIRDGANPPVFADAVVTFIGHGDLAE